MGKNTKFNLNRLYFSEKMRKKVEAILEYPMTTVTAPAGYGKTTAIKNYISSLGDRVDSAIIRVNDTPEAIWESLINGIAECVEEQDEELKNLVMPTDASTRNSFKNLLKSVRIKSGKEHVLVFEDFHNLKYSNILMLIDIVVRVFFGKIHLVLISRTRILKQKQRIATQGKVNAITTNDLRFNYEDIMEYYSLCGVNISVREAENLEKISQGWVSFLYLNLKSYADMGHFASMIGINKMMGEIIFEPLPDKHKLVLSVLSILPVFSLEQAVYVCNIEDADELLLEMTEDNAFIKFNNKTQLYSMHNLLAECVTKSFENLNMLDKRKFILRAGEWDADHGDYISAMRRFYSIRAFDNLMSTVEKDQGASLTYERKDEIVKWLNESPRVFWTRHPLAMLIFARRLVSFDMKKMCSQMLDEVLYSLSGDDTMSDSEKKSIIGEIEIVEIALSYNNLRAMTVHAREACELMDRPTNALDPKAPWGNGSPSVLFAFSRVSGEIDKELEILKEYMQLWYKISQNQGRGAEHIMEAELHYQRGEIEKSKECMERAKRDAEKYDQVCILVCVHFIAMRIELFEGDPDKIDGHLEEMRKLVAEPKQNMLKKTVDFCESWIFSTLRQTSRIPDWIEKGEYEKSSMLYPAATELHLVRCKVLLIKEQYDELLKIEKAEFEMAEHFPTLQYSIHLGIIYAIVYDKKNKHKMAISHLDNALRLALPDRIMMPFAEIGAALSHLMREIPRKREYEELDELLDLMEKYSRKRRKMINKHFSATPIYDLSKRELQIAELAAGGSSNKEIAIALGITENTVKSSLRLVFKKLNIGDDVKNKRRELDNYFK